MNEIIVALIAFSGTLCGTFGGIITSAKLTNYRIKELEKKVERHNKFAEKIPVIQEQIKTLNRRVDEIGETER